MNVLITSAGRRTSLLQAFQQAAHRRGGKLFAGDMDGLAPALYLADEAIRLPSVRDPEYISSLLELTERRRINLLVPTIDTELPLLAKAAPAFADRGCHALVSSAELVSIAADKWETVRAFRSQGIRVPRSWLPEDLPQAALPEHLFVKPRDGSASRNIHAVHRDQLMQLLPRVLDPLIQEEVKAPEITIDALLSLSGQPIHYVPRLRIRTVGGESIQGVTLPDAPTGPWIRRVLEVVVSLGGRGPITLQAFMSEEGPLFSEINPRFGGGVPLTFAASGQYPEWIMQILEGKDVEPRLGEYKTGLYMTRHYTELFTEAPLWR
jgi:carbamoyl-phosphate synthase large subunit